MQKTNEKPDTSNDEAYFRFLDSLRESGKVNMFGAYPYLADAFGISKTEAKAAWVRWAQSFATRHPQE